MTSIITQFCKTCILQKYAKKEHVSTWAVKLISLKWSDLIKYLMHLYFIYRILATVLCQKFLETALILVEKCYKIKHAKISWFLFNVTDEFKICTLSTQTCYETIDHFVRFICRVIPNIIFVFQFVFNSLIGLMIKSSWKNIIQTFSLHS